VTRLTPHKRRTYLALGSKEVDPIRKQRAQADLLRKQQELERRRSVCPMCGRAGCSGEHAQGDRDA